MSESLEVLVRELMQISKGVSEGLLSIVIPPPHQTKIKWCYCSRCGRWHKAS